MASRSKERRFWRFFSRWLEKGISVWTKRYGAIRPLEIKVNGPRIAFDRRQKTIDHDGSVEHVTRIPEREQPPYNSTPLWVTQCNASASLNCRVPKMHFVIHFTTLGRCVVFFFFLPFFLALFLFFLSLSLFSSPFSKHYTSCTVNRERSVQ